MKFLGRLIGAMLMGLAVVGVLFCVLAMIDPRGSKMSDDGDPFGEPPSLAESASMGGCYLLLGICGLILFRLSRVRIPAGKSN
jgi:hypothetical protein